MSSRYMTHVQQILFTLFRDLHCNLLFDEPIFQSLNILNFRKLVIQRVSLLMFKISKCDIPNPYMLYLELIIHIIIIRQGGVSLFTFQLVGPKLYIKLLVILVLTYGITYLIIFQQMCLILPLNTL